MFMLNFEMPKDIRNYVLNIQNSIKKKKNVKLYSQQLTIVQIIREHKELSEKVKLFHESH